MRTWVREFEMHLIQDEMYYYYYYYYTKIPGIGYVVPGTFSFFFLPRRLTPTTRPEPEPEPEPERYGVTCAWML